MRSAMAFSRVVSGESVEEASRLIQVRVLLTGHSVTSMMLKPSTVTAKASLRRRLPPHSGQGFSPINSAMRMRIYSDWVSR